MPRKLPTGISNYEKQDAKNQLETYRQTEDLKRIPNLKCYSVVAVKDDLFVEEV